MSEIRRATGRRIAFITAAKSLQRAFVGLAARLMQSSKQSFTVELQPCAGSG